MQEKKRDERKEEEILKDKAGNILHCMFLLLSSNPRKTPNLMS